MKCVDIEKLVHSAYRDELPNQSVAFGVGERLQSTLLAAIAEFERELIRERVAAGMAEAKKRGKHVGRRHTLRPLQRAEAARLHTEEGKSLAEIAALFDCGRSVVHRAVQTQRAALLARTQVGA